MGGADLRFICKVCDCASNPQQPVIAPRAEPKSLCCARQHRAPLGVRGCDLIQQLALSLGICAQHWLIGKSRGLSGACARHAGSDHGRAFGRGRQFQIAPVYPGYLKADVKAVQQRARDPAQIVIAAFWGARTGP